MEKIWYVEINGRTAGPFPTEEVLANIKSGALAKSKLKKINAANWGSWENFPELGFISPKASSDILPQLQRPSFSTSLDLAQLYTEMESAKKARAIAPGLLLHTQQKNRLLTFIILLVALVVFAVSAWNFMASPKTAEPKITRDLKTVTPSDPPSPTTMISTESDPNSQLKPPTRPKRD